MKFKVGSVGLFFVLLATGVVSAQTTTIDFNNGKKLYEVKDETFKEAGKVGVWTKADSVIYFDDLQITVK
jgi:hypothetical protein